jgi:hypothetical protein
VDEIEDGTFHLFGQTRGTMLPQFKHARQAILIDSTFWIGCIQFAQVYGQIGETDLALISDFEALVARCGFAPRASNKS